MKPLTYYKWHWQDWRANRNVQRMSYIERGLYRELLDECWSEGFIENDLEKMADICGCPVDVMASAWQVLSKCFIEKDGVLINERLNNERTEKDAERVKRQFAGRAGGSAKLLKEVEKEASAKQVLSKCHIEEKRREEKRRENLLSSDDDTGEQKSGKPQIDYDAIFDLYNTILSELPSVKLRTDKRKSAIRSCSKMKPTYSSTEFWEAYFESVKKSDYLMGRTGKSGSWKPAFDWLTAPSNFVKVVEGIYA